MRKIVLALFSSFMLTLFASAQITKGSTFVGGSLGLSGGKQKTSGVTTEEGKIKSFSFSPAIGKAIKENLITGIKLSYGHTEAEKYYQYDNTENTTLGGGIFLRRYFPIANKFYLFGEIDANVNSTESKQDYNSGSGNYRMDADGWNVQLGLTPGISYNIYKAFHLEMSFNNLAYFRYENLESKETNNVGNVINRENKNYSFRTSLSGTSYLNVGVRFIIPKK